MHYHIALEEDQSLKNTVLLSKEQKPSFPWDETLSNQCISEVIIYDGEEEMLLSLNHLAMTIGEALTHLLLSRGVDKDGIYTEENCHFVTSIAHSVAQSLAEQVEDSGKLQLSKADLFLFIEKALIEEDAHDVAKALVFIRSLKDHGEIEVGHVSREPFTVRLIRRNGNVVPWSASKVENAVRQAFLTLKLDSSPSHAIAQAVTERVREEGKAFVHIEDVQDMVQEELMAQKHFKVATHYILYRAERAQNRKQEEEIPSQESQQESMVLVTDAKGNTSFWDGIELQKRIQFASIGLDLSLDEGEIESELRRSIGAEISAENLRQTIILNAKSLIERDADFSLFAGRILLSYIYEEVLGWSILHDGIEGLKKAHKGAFKKYLKYAVRIGRLSSDLTDGRYNIQALADALDPSADLNFDFLGISTLYDRYLISDKTSGKARRIETPQFFWMRVAMGLFKEDEQEKQEGCISLYNLYKSRRFCSSTPTLFNAGTLHSQLSSCYLYKVDDSIESIMQRGIAENAYLSKWAGGLGGSWTAVRGTGSYIQGTNGESQGLIPFLKLHNDQLVAVNQGGKRRGSGCAYVETWHNDIEDFLELRRNTGDERRRTHDMNTANWIPDLFMKRMEAREIWTLFRASQTPDLHDLYGKAFEERYEAYEAMAARGEIWSRQIPAIEMWKKMLKMIFETGHPWFTFKDPCNVRSPQDHVGVVHSSNLCTEITLNTSDEETAVCNLGSIVLDTHMRADGSLDMELLQETIHIAIRALDNVIDINFYPTEAAKTANSRHRPIGLGVMGLQNALYKKGIPFASKAALEFNDQFMEAIAYYAYEASSDLAVQRGKYSSYKGSKWDRGLLPQDTIDSLEKERGLPVDVPRGGAMDWRSVREKIAKQGMRNSNVLAIAPTATISNIMGTTPCIEPNYKNLYVKTNLGGNFTILNRELVRDLKHEGLWNREMMDNLKYFDGELDEIASIPEHLKEKHRTVFGIPYQYVLDAAARRQKWIDQSQSVNLFIATPDLKTLSHMYRHAWRVGMKTTYYLRSLAANTIEKSTLKIQKDKRGLMAGKSSPLTPSQQACSIQAMLNGEECESCQ